MISIGLATRTPITRATTEPQQQGLQEPWQQQPQQNQLQKHVDKGVHDDEQHKLHMESVLEMGQAASTVSDLVATPHTAFKERSLLKENMEKLEKNHVGLTINVQRVWAAVSHQQLLTLRNFAKAASVLMPLRPAQCAPRDEDGFEDFCLDAPAMWMLVPTENEETNAGDAAEADGHKSAEEEGVSVPDQQQKAVDSQFDDATRTFPTFLQNAFANDQFLTMLRTSISDSCEYMRTWLAQFEEYDQFDQDVGLKTRNSITEINLFCQAYVAAAGHQLLTRETHQAFVKFFLPCRGTTPTVFARMVVAGARKHVEWKNVEAQTVSAAHAELQHGHALLAFDDELTRGAIDHPKALPDNMAKVSDWKKTFRASRMTKVLKKLEDLLHQFVTKAVGGELECSVDDLHSLAESLRNEALEGDVKLREDALVKLRKCMKAKAFVSATKYFTGVATCGEHAAPGLCSQGFGAQLLPLKEQDVADDVKEALSIIQDKIIEETCTLARSLGQESQEDPNETDGKSTLKQGILNLIELQEFLAGKDRLVKAQIDVLSLQSKCAAAVAGAGNRYKEKPSQGTWSQYVKAVAQWTAAKISGPAKSDNTVRFCRACLEGLQHYLQSFRQIAQEKGDVELAALQKLICEYRLIAYGCRDGSSWKKDISEEAKVEDVTRIASIPKVGLLAGPGAKVAACKTELEKASATTTG